MNSIEEIQNYINNLKDQLDEPTGFLMSTNQLKTLLESVAEHQQQTDIDDISFAENKNEAVAILQSNQPITSFLNIE